MKPAKNVLLTGAGFTKDFGGYLGDEMWSVIFSQAEVSRHQKIRDYLLREEDLDYEKAYSEVQEINHFTEIEKEGFTRAITESYRQMHHSVCGLDYVQREKAKILCRAFVSRFVGSGSERGFFFTLNQDLFIERFYSISDVVLKDRPLTIPGVEHSKWFNGELPSALEPEDWITLPDTQGVDRLASVFWEKDHGTFSYIKLHGSYGWKSGAGSKAIVIGSEKAGLIDREPILKWSLSTFKRVLHEPNRNLVVIGYGFKDAHINSVIAEAIRDHQLRLYVISPKRPIEFRNLMLGRGPVIQLRNPVTELIWQGLRGYYCARASDFYREDTQTPTPMGQALIKNLGLTE